LIFDNVSPTRGADHRVVNRDVGIFEVDDIGRRAPHRHQLVTQEYFATDVLAGNYQQTNQAKLYFDFRLANAKAIFWTQSSGGQPSSHLEWNTINGKVVGALLRRLHDEGPCPCCRQHAVSISQMMIAESNVAFGRITANENSLAAGDYLTTCPRPAMDDELDH
jgi:hypothetical protein